MMIVASIKTKIIQESIRIDSKFFLNEDAINSRVLEDNLKLCQTLDSISFVFNPPIFKRQFCKYTERAVEYCQSSDVSNSIEGSNTYINKAQAIKVGAIVKQNQILITGFGTIGNTYLVNEVSSGNAFANNVCRVEANPNNYYGFIYGFLTSKYGRSQLNKNASGSVVRYIEAPGIRQILVPKMNENFKKNIHELIVTSSNLRMEANKKLKLSISHFDTLFPMDSEAKLLKSVNVKSFTDYQKRIDSSFALLYNQVKESFKLQDIKYTTIGNLTKRIFIGPRSKRVYTKKGIPFLSTANMQRANPTRVEKFISEKYAKDFRVSRGWILTTRSGTLGNTIIVPEVLNEFAVSEDAIRIVIEEGLEINNLYVFTFLCSKIGKKYLLSGAFGSVIQHLNEDFISSIIVPILKKDNIKRVKMLTEQYLTMIDQSIKLENQAVKMIENEIESWQN